MKRVRDVSFMIVLAFFASETFANTMILGQKIDDLRMATIGLVITAVLGFFGREVLYVFDFCFGVNRKELRDGAAKEHLRHHVESYVGRMGYTGLLINSMMEDGKLDTYMDPDRN